MSEKVSIGQVPQAAGIVSHDIDGSRHVMVSRDVAIVTLMDGIEAKELGAGCDGSSGALTGPRDRCLIVARQPNRTFGDIASVCKNIFVGNDACQLQI